MSVLAELYRSPLALLTDLYQLTMACAHWRLGRGDLEACFHLGFRESPFEGGYAIACGQATLVEYVAGLRFTEEDLAYLAAVPAADGSPLFDAGFLDHLAAMRFEVDLDAVAEGRVVFPHEPVLRIRGPLAQCQLLETAALNIMNFQSLVATKASRVVAAARMASGEARVLEFGLRRAQGIDGGIHASRAAVVGGCTHTSNVLAGRLFGIPVAGTHAHSWVMSFDDELEAFVAWGEAMPNNVVLLVDTYDSIAGVRNAVRAAERLRAKGIRVTGIRLDSGDLAWLSIEARRILDEAGLSDVRIVASNNLDEHVIASLADQDARIDVWGVGTKLATAYDQPAFGGVYKLAAIRRPGGDWEPRLKVSEQSIKTSVPGVLQVRRFEDASGIRADMVWDERHGPPEETGLMIDPHDPTRRRPAPRPDETGRDLLEPMLRGGRPVREPEPLADARARAHRDLERLHPGIRRFVHPHEFPVGLERRLHEERTELILAARDAAQRARAGTGGDDA